MIGNKAIMLGAVRTCPNCNTSLPNSVALPSSANVFINGKPALRAGDTFSSCVCPSCNKVIKEGKIAPGSSTIFINGVPLAVDGCSITGGGVVIGNSPNVFAGDSLINIANTLSVSKEFKRPALDVNSSSAKNQSDTSSFNEEYFIPASLVVPVTNSKDHVIKPLFQRLWDAFPLHSDYPNLKALYEYLGGKAVLNIAIFGEDGNACASRLSVAFNGSSAPIDRNIINKINIEQKKNKDDKNAVNTTGDKYGNPIIYRVAEFKKYLQELLGNPVVSKTEPYDDVLNGKSGIIVFNKHFLDATGHITLWNGVTCREPLHDNEYLDDSNVTKIEFWELQ